MEVTGSHLLLEDDHGFKSPPEEKRRKDAIIHFEKVQTASFPNYLIHFFNTFFCGPFVPSFWGVLLSRHIFFSLSVLWAFNSMIINRLFWGK